MRQTCLNTVGPELAELQAAARPIPARDRSEFLRDVVAELGKYPELGPGIIGRVTAGCSASISRHARATTSGSKYGALMLRFVRLRVQQRQPHCRVPFSNGVASRFKKLHWSVIMIEPKQSDIGRKVIYRVHSNAKAEEGVISRFNEKYVFVRFGKEEKSVVTTRDQLEWKDA